MEMAISGDPAQEAQAIHLWQSVGGDVPGRVQLEPVMERLALCGLLNALVEMSPAEIRRNIVDQIANMDAASLWQNDGPCAIHARPVSGRWRMDFESSEVSAMRAGRWGLVSFWKPGVVGLRVVMEMQRFEVHRGWVDLLQQERPAGGPVLKFAFRGVIIDAPSYNEEPAPELPFQTTSIPRPTSGRGAL